MGLAYIVQAANFSAANLGKVTQTGDIPVEGLAIIGPSAVTGDVDAAAYTASFIPVNTSQRGVTWSIIDGSSYASINPTTGVLSVLPGASLNNVTIRAISTADPTIMADKVLQVSYTGGGFIPLEDLTARINFSAGSGAFKTDIVPSVGDYFKVKVARFAERQLVFFGSRKLSNADDDSVMFEIDNTGISYLAMRAKMYGTRYTSADVMATSTRYTVIVKPDGVTSDPSVGNFTSSSYTFSQAYAIAIGTVALANNTVMVVNGVFDFFGLEIYGSNDVLKHRLIPQSDLTILDEVTGVSYSPTSTTGLIYADDV